MKLIIDDMMHPVGKMIHSGEWDLLREETCRRFGFPIDVDQMANACRTGLLKKYQCKPLGSGWSEGTWWMWIKSRIQETDMMDWMTGIRPAVTEHPTCLLHVGFVSILETDEELARLRNEDLKEESKVARSKLHRRLPHENVHPIDRTAMIVAPEKS